MINLEGFSPRKILERVKAANPTNIGFLTVTPSASNNSKLAIDNILSYELAALDGLSSHNPDTGQKIGPGGLLGQYTNRLFGAPYQLLDSVDKRFPNINKHVGTEYLRNFLLNSPILHIRPGMPQYTGDTPKAWMTAIRDVLILDQDAITTLGLTLAGTTIFRKGKQLHRRMFGFRETYLNYMSHVNYMCRSVAIYLGLVGNEANLGTFVSTEGGMMEYMHFGTMRWENYRMFNTYVKSMVEYGESLWTGTGKLATGFFQGIWDRITDMVNQSNSMIPDDSDMNVAALEAQESKNMLDEIAAVFNSSKSELQPYITDSEGNMVPNPVFEEEFRKLASTYNVNLDGARNDMNNAWNDLSSQDSSNELFKAMDSKIKSVAFMVEPVAFTEHLENATASSVLETMVDTLEGGIGSELAFITNSNADNNILGQLTKFIGGTVSGLAEKLTQLVQPVTGGFLSNLASGAIGSIKGQKMIYPEIYKRSNSSMNYQFSVNLSSPYGDPYNYYMNIAVPAIHLIALVAPRMVSSNSSTSPFLVQAYMPGMCTCQLGIIDSMEIQKNPTTKHVSVHGFPLSVKIQFTIKELYNAMGISPANDPVSFLFNETLNDYLTNMAGLIPSATTYKEKKNILMGSLSQYFEGEVWSDLLAPVIEGFENSLYSFR